MNLLKKKRIVMNLIIDINQKYYLCTVTSSSYQWCHTNTLIKNLASKLLLNITLLLLRIEELYIYIRIERAIFKWKN